MFKPKLKFRGLERCSPVEWSGRMVTIYYIQQFNPKTTLDESFQKLNPHSPNLLEEIRDRVKSEFNKCEIRGV